MTNSINNFKRGLPQPLGVSPLEGGINFALFCPYAKVLKLCLWTSKGEKVEEFLLDPHKNRTGNVWHVLLEALPKEFCYTYHIEQLDALEHFNALGKPLLDPFAKAISYTPFLMGKGLVDPLPFDWQGDVPPLLPLEELIIYEMHLKGFTAAPSSQVAFPATFKGMIEKIPHLIDLGVNAVELLPVQAFRKDDADLTNPYTQEKLENYWGYSPLAYFALEPDYGSNPYDSLATIREFKELVRELHKNSIEIFLDVVFNHTGEGNEKGVTFSFKGLAKDVYYITTPPDVYHDFTGCGNSLNCNHPIVIDLILQALRYFVVDMHVDGFRFDLASEFYRGQDGQVLKVPPILEAISKDPILAHTKLIAEPWDAVGLYHVGSYYGQEKRWSEWNGAYKDVVRRFIKGSGSKGDFATRLCGSEDYYGFRGPQASINYITAHDGFTLKDLVSYNQKHNKANGEDNRDGTSFNDSWNCGEEGYSDSENIRALRKRQMRNFHLALMTSQGVPMVLMGDEYGHTKYGNNNTWNQNNELNWLLWDQLKKQAEFYRFYRGLIHFRHQHSVLRRSKFLKEGDVQWHGVKLFDPQWTNSSSFIAFTLKDKERAQDLYIAFNAQAQAVKVELPTAQSVHESWLWVVNTALESPFDFQTENERVQVETTSVIMEAFSALMLIRKAF